MLDNAEQISGPSLSQPEERRPKNDSVESVYLKNQLWERAQNVLDLTGKVSKKLLALN